jgi:hypothetical protein
MDVGGHQQASSKRPSRRVGHPPDPIRSSLTPDLRQVYDIAMRYAHNVAPKDPPMMVGAKEGVMHGAVKAVPLDADMYF